MVCVLVDMFCTAKDMYGMVGNVRSAVVPILMWIKHREFIGAEIVIASGDTNRRCTVYVTKL